MLQQKNAIGTRKQTSTRLTWENPQPCNCGHCTAGTKRIDKCPVDKNGIENWNFGYTSCCFTCPSQIRCAYADDKECRIGKSVNGVDPLISAEWDGEAPNLKCTFKKDDINTVEQLEEFKRLFNEEEYTKLTIDVCSAQSNICMGDMKQCSMLTSTSELGKYCREFTYGNEHLYKVIAENYCFTHNTKDCDCINRYDNAVYKTTKSAYPFEDSCWYAPCADYEHHLVPHEMRNKNCPTSMCGSFTMIDRVGGQVAMTDNNSIIRCNSDHDQTSETTTINDTIKLQYVKNTNFIKNNYLGILALIVCIVCIFVILKLKKK